MAQVWSVVGLWMKRDTNVDVTVPLPAEPTWWGSTKGAWLEHLTEGASGDLGAVPKYPFPSQNGVFPSTPVVSRWNKGTMVTILIQESKNKQTKTNKQTNKQKIGRPSLSLSWDYGEVNTEICLKLDLWRWVPRRDILKPLPAQVRGTQLFPIIWVSILLPPPACPPQKAFYLLRSFSFSVCASLGYLSEEGEDQGFKSWLHVKTY